MTRREKILNILKTNEISCNDLSIRILEGDEYKRTVYGRELQNMNASLSGTLNQMVKRGEIELSQNKGPKGGKVYKLKQI